LVEFLGWTTFTYVGKETTYITKLFNTPTMEHVIVHSVSADANSVTLQ